ncbi:MAG: amidase [Vicinamibacterales bacterium]
MATTITEAAALIRAGQTTAAELVERCLDSIARRDRQLNAFIKVSADDARAAARRADALIAAGHSVGPLHGVPVSVKDLLDLAGCATTAASRVRRHHLATTDAPVLARLRQAGAIFIGKCNLHEFAFGTTGEESAFGPTRNPHAPGHMSGGSSSGSAVSVAAGMAFASIGTDTGGSIRIPAAACGVVGLKPTLGELSCEGIVPLARTLDHVGPIGLTVDDVALVYRAMQDGRSARVTGRDGLGSVRLGVPRRYFLDVIDPDVGTVFHSTVERLRAAGCIIDQVDIPHAQEIAVAYRNTQLFEAAAAHAETLATRPTDYSPAVRHRLEMGRSVRVEDYEQAQRTRKTLRREVDAALDTRQALILPTLPIPAPPSGTERITLGDTTEDLRVVMLRLTQLFNLTGHPAISIPCGTTGAGLPCGAQLVGRRGQTPELTELAAAYEHTIRGHC